MGFYSKHVLPRLIHSSMGQKELIPYRRAVVAGAHGRVLEIGIGSGLNLPHYGPQVTRLYGVDTSQPLLRLAQQNAEHLSKSLTVLPGSAETLPLDTGSIDTVISTWTMCSIADLHRALREVHRVLKPTGHLLFVEHGLAPEPGVRKWQHRLSPFWEKFGGGCHLNRPFDTLIEQAGFSLGPLKKSYAHGPKFATFFYQGAAHPK